MEITSIGVNTSGFSPARINAIAKAKVDLANAIANVDKALDAVKAQEKGSVSRALACLRLLHAMEGLDDARAWLRGHEKDLEWEG